MTYIILLYKPNLQFFLIFYRILNRIKNFVKQEQGTEGSSTSYFFHTSMITFQYVHAASKKLITSCLHQIINIHLHF